MDLIQVAKLNELHEAVLTAQGNFCVPLVASMAEQYAKDFPAAQIVYNVYTAGMVADPATFAELERLHKAAREAHQRFVCPITDADRTGTAFLDAQVEFKAFVAKLAS